MMDSKLTCHGANNKCEDYAFSNFVENIKMHLQHPPKLIRLGFGLELGSSRSCRWSAFPKLQEANSSSVLSRK